MKMRLFVSMLAVALACAFTGASIRAADDDDAPKPAKGKKAVEKKEAAEDENAEAKEQPKAKSSAEELENIAKLGPGVHRVKLDGKGRVKTLIVVGQARISTVLGVSKGTELARRKARQDANAQFVKWLGEKVEIHENAENETTLFMEGSEEADKEALKEAGKSMEKNSDSYKSAAEGLVRGLSMLHSDVNADEKTCTLVFGWSPDRAKAAKHAATHDPNIKDDGDESRADKSDKSADDDSQKLKDKKKIRSKKATADDADEFLK